MGYRPHIGACMKKPAYGLNDAPRRWWNILDPALRSYGLVSTRADRCTYVYYGKQLPKSTLISEKKSSNIFDLEGAVDYLMDPITTPRIGKFMELYPFMLMIFLWPVMMCLGSMGRLRKDFQVGSEDKNDCLFVGQRIQWKHDDTVGVSMFTRTLPLTNFRRVHSTRT